MLAPHVSHPIVISTSRRSTQKPMRNTVGATEQRGRAETRRRRWPIQIDEIQDLGARQGLLLSPSSNEQREDAQAVLAPLLHTTHMPIHHLVGPAHAVGTSAS